MGFYDSEEEVSRYIALAEGFDGRELIAKLEAHLPPGKSVLELGMGPGKDLDILSRNYAVTGSDKSALFVERYRRDHPQADLLLLDGVSLETDRRFDAIYSNKVLIHLDDEELSQSFSRQGEILTPGGVVLHSFWYGEDREEFDGLIFYQMTEERLMEAAGECFRVLELQRYREMEEGDSLYGIFQVK